MDHVSDYGTDEKMAAPPNATDEQAKLLIARYEQADACMNTARALLDEWEPVARSCAAGLEALGMKPPAMDGPRPTMGRGAFG